MARWRGRWFGPAFVVLLVLTILVIIGLCRLVVEQFPTNQGGGWLP